MTTTTPAGLRKNPVQKDRTNSQPRLQRSAKLAQQRGPGSGGVGVDHDGEDDDEDRDLVMKRSAKLR